VREPVSRWHLFSQDTKLAAAKDAIFVVEYLVQQGMG
jgi:hypothetical protein